MSDINNKTTGRSLVISEEVISKIACVAAKEVSGVKDVVSYPSELKTFLNKAISILRSFFTTLCFN